MMQYKFIKTLLHFFLLNIMNIILEIIFLYQMTVFLKGKTFLIGLIGYYNCMQFCDYFLESFLSH